MATENILAMEGVGGATAEAPRDHSGSNPRGHFLRMRGEGLDNDLLDRLAQEPGFWTRLVGQPLDPKLYTGRSAQQVEQFIRQEVDPCLTGERLAQDGRNFVKDGSL